MDFEHARFMLNDVESLDFHARDSTFASFFVVESKWDYTFFMQIDDEHLRS